MDNLTHTLIGVLVGETIARTTAATPDGLPQPQRRSLYVAIMAVGSNLPDLDFLYPLITGSKLDYLLQHRGHTHTLVGALVMAMLMLVAVEAWCRWRHWTLARTDRIQLAGVALLALLLHLAMDFTNNYGIHPFWPFYNGWVYGDSVFIIEPLFWTAAAPLVFLLRTRTARVLVALALVGAIALAFGSGLVPITFAVVLVLLAALLLWVGQRATPRTALLTGVAVWIGVTATFVAARSIADNRIQRYATAQFPGMSVLDRALTPMPVNPLCWDVMLAMTDSVHYSIKHATWSLAPAWLPAGKCPDRGAAANITAPMTAVADPDTTFVRWRGEVVMPRDQLAGIATSDCAAAAFMRFARMPWVLQRGDEIVIGDLRYDLEAEIGFAEIELEGAATRCASYVPPWLPPRQELLR